MTVTVGDVISACIYDDTFVLAYYDKHYDINYNEIYDEDGDPILQVAILYDSPNAFDKLLEYNVDLNNTSIWTGFSALQSAVLSDQLHYVTRLIEHGADLNIKDYNGLTALTMAVSVGNDEVIDLLLKQPQLDVNITGENGINPVLMAYVDDRYDIIDKIIDHPSYDQTYTLISLYLQDCRDLKDYLLTHGPKVNEVLIDTYEQAHEFGLKFDFDDCFALNNLNMHQTPCFGFEGSQNFVGIKLLDFSFTEFLTKVVDKNENPAWFNDAVLMVQDAINFSANDFDLNDCLTRIQAGKLTIIPSGWDGHSITIVIHNDTLYLCNRGELSDGLHGIEEFTISKPENLTTDMILKMLIANGTPDFIVHDLVNDLGLQKIGEIENLTQIVGNCVWTSLEAAVEASFVSAFIHTDVENNFAHQVAKDTFAIWEEFDLDTSLKSVIENQDNLIDSGIYDDLLIKVLKAHHNPEDLADIQRGVIILEELDTPCVSHTFKDEIGQFVIDHFPQSYQEISYMESYTPSYFEYFSSFIFSNKVSENILDQQEAKEYFDFLKACDEYHKANPSITIDDVIDISVNETLQNLFDDISSNTPIVLSSEEITINPISSVPSLLEHNMHSTDQIFA